ncbi:MAG: flagellar brake protein [Rubrivivax sp.]|nr:flagellar brake protein [Rubrivivax sp.]
MQAELQRTAGATAPVLDDFRVVNAVERVALLVALRDSAAPVLMHAPRGAALRTRLWVVDSGASRLAFAVAASDLASPYLEPLLDADEVTAVAHPGHVKLQFDLHGLVLVRGTASAVLQCGLPDEVLRYQRRETFRVCPPVSSPVAYLRHPSIPDMSLALRVLDLSLGGCALRLPDDVPMLAPGTRLGGVTIELDFDTRLRVELTLQHVTHLGHADDDDTAGAGGANETHGADRASGARLGCEWRLQRPEDERALQRWIDHAQVRQRLGQRAAQRAGAPAAAGERPGHTGPAARG